MTFPWLEEQLAELSDRAVNRRLHHGLLLHGGRGIGKYEFAQALANLLLCQSPLQGKACGNCQSCQLNQAESHPDKHEVVSEKQIGVDAIREAIGKLTGTSHLSGNKVLILVDVESMTEAAANALLKSLEEPTSNTYLLLIASHPEQLLPTILSRCEKYKLAGPTFEQCRQWLSTQGFDGVSDEEMLLNRLSPKRILAYLSDGSSLTLEVFEDKLSSLRSGNISASQLASDWQDQAQLVVEWIQYRIASQLKYAVVPDPLFNLNRICIEARDSLNRPGVNKLLVLAGILSVCQHTL